MYGACCARSSRTAGEVSKRRAAFPGPCFRPCWITSVGRRSAPVRRHDHARAVSRGRDGPRRLPRSWTLVSATRPKTERSDCGLHVSTESRDPLLGTVVDARLLVGEAQKNTRPAACRQLHRGRACGHRPSTILTAPVVKVDNRGGRLLGGGPGRTLFLLTNGRARESRLLLRRRTGRRRGPALRLRGFSTRSSIRAARAST